MAKRGRKPLNRGWRVQQQGGHGHMHGMHGMQQQKFERHRSQRLNPEQIGTSVHDESDTISFRNHLLANYILTAGWMDALTTQAVPVSRIGRTPLYSELLRLDDLRARKAAAADEVAALEARLDSWAPDSAFQEAYTELEKSPLHQEAVERALARYEHHFRRTARMQQSVVFRSCGGRPQPAAGCAPDNYWSEIYPRLREQRARRLLEERKRRREEEKLKEQAGAEQMQLQLPADAAAAASTAHQAQTAEPPSAQMLDTMFNDIDQEPFNNGFDDAFGELDSAFF
ncbi:AFR185Cp [Eremothecium gossypii ATCC 10895]|uniref:AFR185Cp n=1 Tax=Eremothecium gossypii (strain ATCC 10895 / CBS 109.51 / FGSC 9923 / NRRL Y-1056) TaxID=284811 RepID=Q753Y7_EREGS|nr:AFR185Cp [Eremothecium gossypii ATCC 10895]AAS53556.2 AFR185Cp [Eremothecium gossypii ATCC 10895]AEY97869.1 FAFR185Cp [Eremothecium gossypii FDAG1]